MVLVQEYTHGKIELPIKRRGGGGIQGGVYIGGIQGGVYIGGIQGGVYIGGIQGGVYIGGIQGVFI